MNLAARFSPTEKLLFVLILLIVGFYSLQTESHSKSLSLIRGDSGLVDLSIPAFNSSEKKRGRSWVRKLYLPRRMSRGVKFSKKDGNLNTVYKLNTQITSDGKKAVALSCTTTGVWESIAWHQEPATISHGGPATISCYVKLARDCRIGKRRPVVELLVSEYSNEDCPSKVIEPLSDSDARLVGTPSRRIWRTDTLLTKEWKRISVSFLVQATTKKLDLRIALPMGLAGTMLVHDLRLERQNLIAFFKEQYGSGLESKGFNKGLLRRIEHMAVAREALLLPAKSSLEYRFDKLKHDKLTLEYAWKLTGLPGQMELKLLFASVAGQKEIWSSLSTNDGMWKKTSIPLESLSKLKGRLQLTVSLKESNESSQGGKDISGSAVLLLGDAVLHKEGQDKSKLPNIVLFSVDSLTPDALAGGAMSHLYTTPNFDRLLKKSAANLNCFTAGTMTHTTIPSYLTSRYPNANGVVFYGDQLHPNLPSIGSVLEKRGYEVIQFSRDTIFQHIWRPCMVGFPVIKMRPTQEEAEADLLKFLDEEHERPFFAYLHTDTRYHKLPLGPEVWGDELLHQRKYRQLVLRADALLGQLMVLCEKQRKNRPTMLVVVADHGEDIKGAPLKWSHCHMYDTCLRTPFIVDLPGVTKANHIVARQTRAIDIAPTVLGLVGLPSPAEFDGSNLSDLFSGVADEGKVEPAPAIWGDSVTEKLVYSIRIPPWKYIYNPDENVATYYPVKGFTYEKEELYNIKKDPNERNNVANEHPQVCNELRSKLAALVMTKKTPTIKHRDLFLNLLRDGYVETRTKSHSGAQ